MIVLATIMALTRCGAVICAAHSSLFCSPFGSVLQSCDPWQRTDCDFLTHHQATDMVTGQCAVRGNGGHLQVRARKATLQSLSVMYRGTKFARISLVALPQLAWRNAAMLVNKPCKIRGAAKVQVGCDGFCGLSTIYQGALRFVYLACRQVICCRVTCSAATGAGQMGWRHP